MKKILFLLLIVSGFQAKAQDCVDPTLIDPNIMCPMIYDPVCGCDGVTYSNSCVATYTGGVTSYTPGECGASSGCLNMEGMDFGMCDMWLGYAWTSNGCVGFSGCGYVTEDGTDYSPYFYENIEDCESICGGASVDSCINQWQIDQGALVLCFNVYDPVCGCDGVTYSNACVAYYSGGVTTYAMGECGTQPSDDCMIIPSAVNFGDCAMPLGYARQDGNMCVSTSGCSYIGDNGYDYTDYFFSSEYACNNFCIGIIVIECIDSSLINLDILCPAIWDPVCGCDSVTYSNSCVALNHNGVTSYTAGECPTAGVIESEEHLFNLYPNPARDVVTIDFKPGTHGTLDVYDVSGKLIMNYGVNGSLRAELDVERLDPGSYFVRVYDPVKGASFRKFVKE